MANPDAPVHVGLDIGNGSYKGVCYETRHQVIDYSTVASNKEGLRGIDGVEPSFTDSDGNGYLIGSTARKFGKTDQSSVDSSFVRRTEYRVLNLHALRELKAGNANVVAGLPLEWYTDQRKWLEKNLPTWRTKKVHIDRARVVPQPLGTLVDIAYEWNGQPTAFDMTRKIAVIDIGQGTVDAIEAVDGQMSPHRYRGRNRGVHTMHEELRSWMADKYREADLRPEDMDRYVREGKLFYQGEEQSLEKLIRDAKANLVKQVKSLVNETWEGGTGDLYALVFTGGGAALLSEALRKHFPPKQVVIPEEPSMSNARGFAKLARFNA